MSNLVNHARRELSLTDNDEEFNDSIIKAVEGFASYGHSGGSAAVAIHILHDLLQFKNLSPLTNNPDEWMKITENVADDENTWQSRRNPEAFSDDGGKTYYLLSDRDGFGGQLPRYESEKV